MRDIADVLADRLGLPTAEVSTGRAAEHFGYLAPFVAADSPAVGCKARDLLGWSLAHPGLLAHLR
ncbi:hypothetical protein [Actinacidiphila sp. bgisy145]|uniref:hypothetical protein n=1 Tax=Actinacidiphila sp. bgisy145 TaxID=3413792 RepID=UPI003EBEAAA3